MKRFRTNELRYIFAILVGLEAHINNACALSS